MEATQHMGDVMTKLVPGGEHSLAHLTDKDLLANTRRLTGKSNQLFAALLLHLAEVEARGIHRTRLCASLYTYCIYELRFSEDAAARRSSAARLVKQFPLLFDAIANGELHLTGLLMHGPHLTPENHVEVLGRAKFRTKKEIGKLVRDLCPLPQVPDRVEPLGPAPARVIFNPSWATYVASLEPAVRELRQGERPRDWANDGGESGSGVEESEAEPLPVGPVPADLPPVTGPQQYQMQFTTVEEHARLVERAKALLAKSKPGVSLGELHLEAMKLLVAALEKEKFAVTDRAPAAARSAWSGQGTERETWADEADLRASDPDVPRRRGAKSSRKRSRHIPAAERREVFLRDGGRCTYVDSQGERCCEERYLEIHHLQPFGRQGASIAANLTLRCAAHNALAAEHDFGPELIARKRDELRHESLASLTRRPSLD